jgi:hypothetical protein
MEELKRKLQEIKTLCDDRMDAITADGNVLADVFKAVESILESMDKKTK